MTQQDGLQIPVRRKPDQETKLYDTRTIHSLPGLPNVGSIPLTAYGGRADRIRKATGFFYPLQEEGRWWLVDPEGGLFLNRAVVSVNHGRSANNQEELNRLFGGSRLEWAQHAMSVLAANGFNGTGAWSDDEHLRMAKPRMAYTPIWNFMSGYGAERGSTFWQPGHTGYPNNCIFVFEPEFEAYCDRRAQKLAETKDDPYLLGHFSDNEMPFPERMLDNYLELDPDDHGYRAARAWLEERKGKDAGAEDITSENREQFRGYAADRYYAITTRAIRKYDPNHLCLGSRFYSSEKRCSPVFQAAGRHLDVVSVNYYWAWSPNQETLSQWAAWSGRPVMITEWYAKGMDSGLPNVSGAGWVVPTQRDRGLFYQNFTLGLLETKVCVGWHWFRYMDNDPGNSQGEPSNENSNKGVVTIQHEPYDQLLNCMKEVNERTYEIVDWLDQENKGENR